jgi:hypothetical protein
MGNKGCIFLVWVMLSLRVWAVTDARSVAWRGHIGTVTELKTLDPANYQTNIIVNGYYTPGDGGGGIFKGTTSTALSADDGMVILPASFTGRWIRQDSGPLNPRWFGAMDDGLTDYYARYNAMVKYAELNGKAIRFPPSKLGFVVSRMSMTNAVGLVIEGTQTRIKHKYDASHSPYPTANTQYCFMVGDDSDYTVIRGFVFQDNDDITFPNGTATSSGNNAFIAIAKSNNVLIEDCQFTSTTHQAVGCGGSYLKMFRCLFDGVGVNFGIGTKKALNFGMDGSSTAYQSSLAPEIAFCTWTNGAYKKALLLTSAPGFNIHDNRFAITQTLADQSVLVAYGGDTGFTDETYGNFKTEYTGTIRNNIITGNFYTGIEVRNSMSEGDASNAGNANLNTSLTCPVLVVDNSVTGGRLDALHVSAAKFIRVIGNRFISQANPLGQYGDCSGAWYEDNEFTHNGNLTAQQAATLWMGQDVSGNITIPDGVTFFNNRITSSTNDEWIVRFNDTFGNNAKNFSMIRNKIWFNGINSQPLSHGTPLLGEFRDTIGKLSLIDNTIVFTNFVAADGAHGMQDHTSFIMTGTNGSLLMRGNSMIGTTLATNVTTGVSLPAVPFIASGPIATGGAADYGWRFSLNASLSVTGLARMKITGNNGTHLISILNAAGTTLTSGTVDMNTGGLLPGQKHWVACTPVTLNTGQYYWCVSAETAPGAGDAYYDNQITVKRNTDYIKDICVGLRVSPAVPTIATYPWGAPVYGRIYSQPDFGFSGNVTNLYQQEFVVKPPLISGIQEVIADGNVMSGLDISTTTNVVITRNTFYTTNNFLVSLTGVSNAVVSLNTMTNRLAGSITPPIYLTNTDFTTVNGNMIAWFSNTPPVIAFGNAGARVSYTGNLHRNPNANLYPWYGGGLYLDWPDRIGTGSPNSVYPADIGQTFRRTDGGAGTSFYVKESIATSNTVWTAK